MTSLRFTNHRPITSLDQLDDALIAQLAAAGRRYDGVVAPASARIAPEGFDDEPEEGGPLYNPEVWDVVDAGGAPVYQVWFYSVDSGTVFRAGTTDAVADIIQFDLETQDPTLGTALADAKRAAGDVKGTGLGLTRLK
jgi:hypothetical protein